MEQILNFLGFTDMAGIFWNSLAYIGMILITIAVLSPKWQKQFFIWGPVLLLLYSWLYLHNPILIWLQLIIIVSAGLNLLNVKKIAPFIVITLAVVAFVSLLMAGQISGLWYWFGALGLLGIALGLTQLPKKNGFYIMALGGLLVIVYSLGLQIWVFFVLNIIFFVANLLQAKKMQ